MFDSVALSCWRLLIRSAASHYSMLRRGGTAKPGGAGGRAVGVDSSAVRRNEGGLRGMGFVLIESGIGHYMMRRSAGSTRAAGAAAPPPCPRGTGAARRQRVPL